MRIVLVASGGGHTGYAIALAERLIELEPDIDLVFALPLGDRWSLRRLLRRIGPRYPICFTVKPRNPLESALKMLLKTPKAFVQSLKCVNEPYMVVGTGSNHSLYPVVAGLVKKARYLFTVEAIDRVYTYSKASMTLYKYFRAIPILHWEEQKRNYPRGVVAGPIVEKPVYKPVDKGYILVVTGSMGHKKLFDLLVRTSLEKVVVQTGRIDPSYILSRKPMWRAFRFDPDIDRWIAGASVVVGHQGLTIAEAAIAYGKPVVLAFNPDLPGTSGYIDSVLLARRLNGVFLDTSRASPRDLEEAIHRAMKLKRPRFRDGALALASIILKQLL